MTSPAPSLDIVIPTRNTSDQTIQCLRSLHDSALVRAGSFRCVVVDNASTDRTSELVRRHFPSVDLIENASNVGFAKACNVGACRGNAPLILFLNSDTVAQPGAVDRLAEFMAKHERCVVAGARLVDFGTSRTQVGFVVRGFPRLATQLALLVGLERYCPTNPVSRQQLMLDFDYARTQYIDAQPAGACLMCRRLDFEAVGGFDETFFFWFEDVDLVRRLHGRGEIAYVHDAVFEHIGSNTFAQWERPEIVIARYRSLLHYFSKHHSRGQVMTLRAAVALLAAVRFVALRPFEAELAKAYGQAFRMATFDWENQEPG